ncbi:oligosaccharide flippase family protein [Halobacillus litoralis]|uniref:Oligosaccharide flippase family protein n=1 Tax=Halobacillus litoralis TaxID=45668 RepID=A0A845DT38_9BACI|nr:oligosaccharide flippase family protein [Halobacillus litoralis]MYL20763.1 oligosaccharide flippase family protein [Halobacillus litoralis]
MKKTQSFKQYFLALAKGNLVSQILMILGVPLLAGLYSPADFGILAVYSTVLAMGLVVSAFTFEKTIPIEEDRHASENLIYLSLFSVFISTGSGALVLTLIHTIVSIPHYYILLAALSGCWLAGSFQVMVQAQVRRKNFSLIAKCKVTQNVIILIGQVMFFTLLDGYGLIVGDLLGRIVSVVLISRQLTFASFDRAVLMSRLGKYKSFALYSSAAVLLNSASIQLPLLSASVLYGEAAGGSYLLSYKVVGVPVTLVALAYSQVYYGTVSRQLAEGKSRETVVLFTKTIRKFFFWSIGPLAVIVWIGPIVMRWVLGEEWTDAATVIQLLAPLFLMQITALPVSQTLYLLQKQTSQLAWEAVRLIGIITIWWGGSWFGFTIFETISTYAWFGALSYFCFLLICRKHLGGAKQNKGGTTWVDAVY